jgi:hypothetical protein
MYIIIKVGSALLVNMNGTLKYETLKIVSLDSKLSVRINILFILKNTGELINDLC